MHAKELAVRALGCPLLAQAAIRCTPDGLRIIAYHGVPEPSVFDQHVTWMRSEFEPLCGSDVAHLLNRRRSFPKRALWITFDDGLASVVRNGLPVLEAHDAPATLFVSPGLAEQSPRLPWWSQVALAVDGGWTPPGQLSADQLILKLKTVPDAQRRRIVGEAWATVSDAVFGETTLDAAANSAELSSWLASGREIGNHTWDHPCLDHCSEEEQHRQIERADSWLECFGAFEDARLFAYPNGDWTVESERVLREMGYDSALLFDHRVASQVADPLRLSRLRLDSAAPLPRARAVVSGVHSWSFALSRRNTQHTGSPGTAPAETQRSRSERTITGDPVVVAVVVTFQRHDVVRATLGDLVTQPGLSAVVLVDNAGDLPLVTSPDVDVELVQLTSPSNDGFGAGLAIGMDYARVHFDPDYYWLMDDDSAPREGALIESLEVARSLEHLGSLNTRAGSYRRGRIRHLPGFESGSARPVDWTLVDGALISRAAVDVAGVPRRDFFMMLEDFEYTSRLADAGFTNYQRAGSISDPQHLGSASDWRHYYQARNLLRIAIERRSLWGIIGWAGREARIQGMQLAKRELRPIPLRWRGARDAVLGRMGRRIGPS